MSSIATKLTTTANNTLAVAEAVNAAKVTASGAVVRVDDVLDTEHGLQVRLQSDSVTDFSGVAVKVYGKNLANIYGFSTTGIKTPESARVETKSNYGTTISTINPANSITVTQELKYTKEDMTYATDYRVGYFCMGVTNQFKEGDEVVISFDLEILTNPLKTTVMGVGANGIGIKAFVLNGNGRYSVASTWQKYADRQYIEFRNVGCNCVFSNFQVEYGDTATDYEPYKEAQTAAADASGKVSGLVSVAPTMTLLTDTEAVIIECAYFPESAADTYAKYQKLKQEQTALRDKLQEYLHEEE